jgi:hypothetical protein
MRWKTLWTSLATIMALIGCQGNSQATLNDKKLTIQDHMNGAYPRYYDHVDKKTAARAIPFSLDMPKELPFPVVKTTHQISDWGEKRNIMLETVFYPEQEGQNVYLAYRVSNFLPVDEKIGSEEAIKLQNGTKAYFSGTDNLPILSWKEDGMYYKMEYLIKEGKNPKREKEKLVKAASSIYE